VVAMQQNAFSLGGLCALQASQSFVDLAPRCSGDASGRSRCNVAAALTCSHSSERFIA
jgi:hypothetical protein